MRTHGQPSDSPRGERSPHVGKPYASAAITVHFDADRCRHFGECVRGLPEVFDVSARPWIQPDHAAAETVAEVIRRCPSGALQYRSDSVAAEHPQRPTTVEVGDPGYLLLNGELKWRLPDGTTTQETRLSLCGCGRSATRPHCDASCEHQEG